MKVYSIADESRETYGFGDYGIEQRIIRQGGYGSGDFPPLFTSMEEAQRWIDEQEYPGHKTVVELELIGL